MIRLRGKAGHHALYGASSGAPLVVALRGHSFRVLGVSVTSRQRIRATYRTDAQRNINAQIWRRVYCENGIVLFEFFGDWINVVQYGCPDRPRRKGKMVEQNVQLTEITGLDALPRGTRPTP